MPSDEPLDDRTPPWQPGSPAGLAGGGGGFGLGGQLAHGPLLSPRGDGRSSGASSAPDTPASARSPAAFVLPPVREVTAADADLLGGRSSSDFGGSLGGSRSSSPSRAHRRSPSPMGLPPLSHGRQVGRPHWMIVAWVSVTESVGGTVLPRCLTDLERESSRQLVGLIKAIVGQHF